MTMAAYDSDMWDCELCDGGNNADWRHTAHRQLFARAFRINRRSGKMLLIFVGCDMQTHRLRYRLARFRHNVAHGIPNCWHCLHWFPNWTKENTNKKNCVSLLWRGWRCIWRLCDDGDGPMLVYQPWLWNGSLWNLAAWSESRCLHWRRVIKKRGICGEFVREFFCLRWSLDYMIWQTKFWRWFCLRYSQICWMHAL